MSPEIVAAIISGGSAAVVAILASVVSYYRGRSTLKLELDSRLAEIKEGGAEDRATAERQYQLEAMKTFRETIGGPKSQIIEAVHDLSDRLFEILSREDWEQTESRGDYRASFVWLIIRPFVWIAILGRSMVHLDQTLGELVESELRFLGLCRRLERSLTGASLFRNTNYDRDCPSAHVFIGRLRTIAEQLIKSDQSRFACMTYSEFELDEFGCGISRAADIERVVSNLNKDPARDYRVARLIAIYCSANSLLEDFHLPYREYWSVDKSLQYLQLLPGGDSRDHPRQPE